MRNLHDDINTVMYY